MNTKQKGILALIIGNVIWGLASPIFKWSLTNVPLYTLAFWRFFFGSLLLAGFLIMTDQMKLPKLSKGQWLRLIGFSLTSITGNIIFFFLGLEHTLAINAPIIASAQPLMIFLIAPFLLKEKVTKRKLWGMAIGTIGIAVIVLEPIYYNGLDGNIIGNVYLVLATVFAVLGTLIGRTLFHESNPLLLMFYAFLIGMASFFPFALYEYGSTPGLYAHIDIKGAIGIFYGAVFSSTIAYTAIAYGLSKITASEASIFTYIDPIAGTILAFFMLNEPITIPFIIGSIGIFLGIFIAEGRIHYHPIKRLLKATV